MSGAPPGRLVERSLEVILQYQDPSGAFPAAPGYPTYQYSWIRDGTFIADTLDRYGHHDAATAFHRWTARTIEQRRTRIDELAALEPRERPPDRLILPTRYALDGSDPTPDWGNFQLDGYGFWLTGIARHLHATGSTPAPYIEAVRTVVDYLTLTCRLPCFDCWEEYPNRHHTTTLAAISKGLLDAADLLQDAEIAATASALLDDLITHGTNHDALTKFADPQPTNATRQIHTEPTEPAAVAGHEHPGKPLAPGAIDASALLVIGAFGPIAPTSPIAAATLAKIEADLVVDGGVRRYLGDEYYGGGLWVLLSGALATVLAERDEAGAARFVLTWIEAQADPLGNLPEQVPIALQYPDLYPPWVDRWGPIGRPLLWSHAMYLTAVAALRTTDASRSL